MRPLHLHIEGFGPFGGVEDIDFNSISKAGIFLITGVTGSGKTSIFDAISFALFGEASGSIRGIGSFRSGYAKLENKTEVKLDFYHSGREYSIIRNPDYPRPKKKSGGSDNVTMQGKDASMYMPDGRVITGFRQVTEEVVELLGVNAEQFKQISMIAQGEFVAMLNSSSDRRSDIFRKVFNTYKFKDIENKLADLRNKSYYVCEDDKKAINQYMSGVRFVDEDMKELYAQAMASSNYSRSVELINEALAEAKNRDKAMKKKLKETSKALDLYTKEKEAIIADNALIEDFYKVSEELLEKEKASEDIAKAYEKIEDYRRELTKLENERVNLEKDMSLYEELELLTKKHKLIKEKVVIQEKGIEENNNKIQDCIAKRKIGVDYVNAHSNVKNERTIWGINYTESEKLDGFVKELDKRIEEYIDKKNKNVQYRDVFINCESIYKSKKEEYDQLEETYMRNQAGIIASKLEEGKPCPVCGSIEHPSICKIVDEDITEAILDTKKADLEKCYEEYSSASQRCNLNTELMEASVKGIKEQCIAVNKQLSYMDKRYRDKVNEMVYVFDDEFVQSMCDLENVYSNLRVETVEDYITSEEKNKVILVLNYTKNKKEENELGEKELNKVSMENQILYDKIEKLQSNILELKDKLNVAKLEEKELDTKVKTIRTQLTYDSLVELKKKLGDIDLKVKTVGDTIKNTEVNWIKIKEEIHRLQGSKDNIVKNLLLHHKDVYNLAKKDLADVDKAIGLEEDKIKAINDHIIEINNEIITNKDMVDKVQNRLVTMENNQKKYLLYKGLSDTANGALTGKDKIDLERYVQGFYFRQVVNEANKRFVKMSNGQFELRYKEEAANLKKASGLELEVMDYYIGNTRPVSSLSGGESFKAALSLSLGMSDVIQSYAGGIEVNTLFIDEGFGSLDSDSLEMAINVLVGLSDGNCMVGIISHVDALKDKIENQIEVIKTNAGSNIQMRN